MGEDIRRTISVINMVKKGSSFDEISEGTGLNIEDISEIASSL